MIKKFSDKLKESFSEGTKGRFMNAFVDLFLMYKNISRYK